MGTKRKLKASNPIPLLYGEGNSGTEWGGGWIVQGCTVNW